MIRLQHRAALKLESLEARVTPATLPIGFTQTTLPGTIAAGTAMEFSPTGLLFVLEQAGTCKVYARSGPNWVVQQTDFLATVTELNPVMPAGTERGLLGIAFDPDYANNRYVYFYHTTTSPTTHNRVIRVTADTNHDLALAGDPTVLLDLPTLGATNHNGGAIHFGPDGKLYIAVGDNAVGTNSQSKANLLGKMLRMNPDGSIPSDNPFFNDATYVGNNKLIWALGLRNPYTFAFKPGTSTMYINDVGQSTFEEVNVGAAGANYGWPATEGPFMGNPQFTHPLVWYHRTQTSNNSSTNVPKHMFNGAAITGGAFYNPTTYTFPEDYKDDYFFADYIGDWIRRVDANGNVFSFATSALGVVDLKVGPEGALYYLPRDNAAVQFAQFTGSSAPYIVNDPTNQTVALGQQVTFSAAAGGINLSYQWQRNGVNISSATNPTYTIPATALGDNNTTYRVVVTNSAGNVTSTSASLTLTGLPAPARVSSVAPNDGEAQRSMVRSLTVSFDSVVHFVAPPTSAFNLGGSTATIVVGAIDDSNGYSVVRLTFTGSGMEASSLENGSYILSIFGNTIQDEANRDLDGDDNGSAGGTNTTNFFRLRGDGDGNGVVDLDDYILFRQVFQLGSSSAFDFNDDGQVGLDDYIQFRSSFGSMI